MQTTWPRMHFICFLRSLDRFSHIRLQLIECYNKISRGPAQRVSRNHSAHTQTQKSEGRNRRKGSSAQMPQVEVQLVQQSSQSLLTFKLCKLLFSSGKCLGKTSLPCEPMSLAGSASVTVDSLPTSWDLASAASKACLMLWLKVRELQKPPSLI